MAPPPVALVTGASSGIGHCTSLRLRRAGFTVYGAARRLSHMQDLESAGIRTIAMDLCDEASTSDAADRVLADEGRIDVLVNSAGYGSYGAVEDVTMDEARAQFEVNIFGAARLTQLFLPRMRDQRSGRVINVGSIAGRVYSPLAGWYHASKHALEGLTDAMRVELAPHGIAVVLVQPGPVLTEWNLHARTALLQASAEGAYGPQAQRAFRVLENGDRPGRATDAETVAAKILKAATTRRPASRYPVGRGARTVIAARSALPDRALDAVLRTRF